MPWYYIYQFRPPLHTPPHTHTMYSKWDHRSLSGIRQVCVQVANFTTWKESDNKDLRTSTRIEVGALHSNEFLGNGSHQPQPQFFTSNHHRYHHYRSLSGTSDNSLPLHISCAVKTCSPLVPYTPRHALVPQASLAVVRPTLTNNYVQNISKLWISNRKP